MGDEICIVVTLGSPELAERVRSRLPGLWDAKVERATVVVVARDEAHAAEIERALEAAVLATAPSAEPATQDAGADAVGAIGGGIIETGISFLDYL